MPIIKKIFFLSVFLFFFSLLLWGVYIISFKKDSPKISESEDTQPLVPENANNKDSGKISAITNEPVLSFAFSNGKIRFFSKASGEAFEVDSSGLEIKNLGAGKNSNLYGAFWSDDGEKAILKTGGEEGAFSHAVYDFTDNSQTPIKKDMENIYWQEGANKIFYKYYDANSKERTLNISDPDGTDWKKLADIPFRYLVIAPVPKSGSVSFWNSGDAWDETIFSSIPIIGGEQKTIMKGKFGADYLWNRNGTSVLVSHADQRGGNKIQLAIINENGGEYKNLDIPAFISKCVWSKDGKTLYYALPGGIPENSILPNDYKEGRFKTADTFWKVNSATGEKKRIVEPEEIKNKFDASQLMLNEDESILVFTNLIDGKIYKIAL